ncbi:MAG: hypothetical protein H0W88_02365 [Parachlamydiaceae bacterium]|nr:hypothetical protein [Parachlamydiaceae bacterium]
MNINDVSGVTSTPINNQNSVNNTNPEHATFIQKINDLIEFLNTKVEASLQQQRTESKKIFDARRNEIENEEEYFNLYQQNLAKKQMNKEYEHRNKIIYEKALALKSEQEILSKLFENLHNSPSKELQSLEEVQKYIFDKIDVQKARLAPYENKLSTLNQELATLNVKIEVKNQEIVAIDKRIASNKRLVRDLQNNQNNIILLAKLEKERVLLLAAKNHLDAEKNHLDNQILLLRNDINNLKNDAGYHPTNFRSFNYYHELNVLISDKIAKLSGAPLAKEINAEIARDEQTLPLFSELNNLSSSNKAINQVKEEIHHLEFEEELMRKAIASDKAGAKDTSKLMALDNKTKVELERLRIYRDELQLIKRNAFGSGSTKGFKKLNKKFKNV